MTGHEVWDLINPLISPITHNALNNKLFGEAFCIVYIALKEYDQNHKGEKKE